jgi:hypothetical protein
VVERSTVAHSDPESGPGTTRGREGRSLKVAHPISRRSGEVGRLARLAVATLDALPFRRPLLRAAKRVRRALVRGQRPPEAALAGGDQLFCDRPFRWLEVSGVRLRGEAHLCCPSWLDLPVGDLSRQTVEEVWNGPVAQQIRASILDGSFRHCDASRCPFLASKVAPVRRRDEVDDPELRLVLDRGLTVLPWGPREINCAFDRSCNLSCPSCRNDLIVEKGAAADEIGAIGERLRTEALPDARVLYVTGSGDPFGSPFFRGWLQDMSAADVHGLERIHLHTNAQLWTRRAWERLPAHVRERVKTCEISVDAASDATYAENRRGGRFETLLENLELVAELRRAGPLGWVGLSFVVQENNFVEMPAFVALAQRFGFDLVMFNKILNWGTFSASEYRRRAVHLADHPRHAELLEVLRDPAFDEPIVHLGNLGVYRAGSNVEVPPDPGSPPDVETSALRTTS